MKPILFTIGQFHIHSFGLLVALGVLTAVYLMTKRAEKMGFRSREEIIDMVFVVVLTGFVGGRVAYIVQYADWYLKHPLKSLAIWEGGLIFYGGMIGSLLGFIAFSKIKKRSVLEGLDFIAPYTALAHSFGRVGCFLNGCCYGKACDLPWAVRFQDLPYPVHPTQVYEALFAFILFLGLSRVYTRRKFKGQVIALYFLIYGLGRFVLEYFRFGNPTLFIWTWNQWLSIVFVLASFCAYLIWKRKYQIHE